MATEVQIRITLNRTSLHFILISIFLLASGQQLGSETLTLTTTYPAPVGIYRSMITTGTGGANTLLSRDAGNVGIGTTAPATQLDVRLAGNTTGDQISFGNAGSGVFGALGFNTAAGANPGYSYWAPATGASALNVMALTTAGDIGIGKTNPGAKLEVNGNVIIDGTLTVTSGLPSGISSCTTRSSAGPSTVACPAGYWAVGGGIDFAGMGDHGGYFSRPASGTTWTCGFDNRLGGSGSESVIACYVQCCK